MNRRAFLRGILALPVVAALAPLLPKVTPKALPAVITGTDLAAAIPKMVRVLWGFSWIGGSQFAAATLRVNGTPVMKAVSGPWDRGIFQMDYPFILRDRDVVTVTWDVPQSPPAMLIPIQRSEAYL